MSVDLSQEVTGATPDITPGRGKRLLVGAGMLLVLALIGVGVYLAWPRFIMPPPQITSFTTAHGLKENQVVGETHVFDQGERVLLVFDLADGRPGQVVSIQVDTGQGVDQAVELNYEIQRQDRGQRAVVFTPSTEGVYTATLALNAVPVANGQVIFSVVEGGPQLQNVTTAPAVDSETFMPIGATSLFHVHDTVFVAYRAVDVTPGDQVSIRYTIDGMLQPHDPLDTVEFERVGNFRGHFSLQGSEARPLSVGTYRAELFYNDEMVAVVNFEVVNDPGSR